MAGSRRSSTRSGGGRLAYARLPSHSGGSYSSGDADGIAAWLTRAVAVRALRGALVVLPWLALLLLVAAHSWRAHRHALLLPTDLPGAKQCVGWRETMFCHPFA